MTQWVERPEVVSYVVDAYAGTEPVGPNARPRRVFLWEEPDGTTYMGNVEAFFDHVAARFGLQHIHRCAGTSKIHALLRALGERMATDGEKHPSGPSPTPRERPAPERWRA